jgi:hypothetical protein
MTHPLWGYVSVAMAVVGCGTANIDVTGSGTMVSETSLWEYLACGNINVRKLKLHPISQNWTSLPLCLFICVYNVNTLSDLALATEDPSINFLSWMVSHLEDLHINLHRYPCAQYNVNTLSDLALVAEDPHVQIFKHALHALSWAILCWLLRILMSNFSNMLYMLYPGWSCIGCWGSSHQLFKLLDKKKGLLSGI